MKNLLLISCLFYAFNFKAQEKSIVIKIDTIVSEFGLTQRLDEFKVASSTDSIYTVRVFEDSKVLKYNLNDGVILNYYSKVILKDSSSIIKIPIDNNQGHVYLFTYDALSNNDTLNIRKIKLFDVKLDKGIITHIEYFRTENGSITKIKEPYKVKRKIKLEKGFQIQKICEELVWNINNKKLKIDFKEIQLETTVTSFNGQKPRKSNNPRIVFYGEEIEFRNIYRGKVIVY